MGNCHQIQGKKIKLRVVKHWKEVLEGEAVASPSLEMPKSWLSGTDLIVCAFKQSVGLNVPPSSVKVTISRLICRRVAFNLIFCSEVPWGAGHVTVVPCSQPFGAPGCFWLPLYQMTSGWQEQCLHWHSLGSSWSVRGLKHRACFSSEEQINQQQLLNLLRISL